MTGLDAVSCLLSAITKSNCRSTHLKSSNVAINISAKDLGSTAGEQYQLVVFDVEGVLLPKNRFIFDLIRSLGFRKLARAMFLGFLYQIGLLALGSALKQIFRMVGGMPKERMIEIAKKIPLLPDVQKTVDQLKCQGRKIAVISSGLPNFVVRQFADNIGADYAFGFEIGLDGQNFNGEIWGDVLERDGKYRVLSQIMEAEGIGSDSCVVVVDDRNNVQMFRLAKLRIGHNPDFLIRAKADRVVTGALSKIIPLIEGCSPKRVVPSAKDFVRETIHLLAVSIPILVTLYGLSPVVALICVVVLLYAISEVARIGGRKLPFFSQITDIAASKTEIQEFVAAPIYFALGILFALLLLPIQASSGAIAIFAAGDSTASLFGGLSKKVLPINKGKTWGGSLAGLLFAFMAGSLFISPWKALVGAAIAAFVEAIPLPINDNILMPLSAGIALTLLI